ncbi:hybrid sensor histidine kinase/response regulator [bacterium]|nr:hybrid sensor histidine kinase/response regulator [bacterium]
MSKQDKELVLIVDDEPRNLQILGSFLKQNGYGIAVAQNGRQAIDFVKNTAPHIILLDVMMPEMDGFEVCRRIKAMDPVREIPILFITALTDTESMLKGFKAGGADYINKPITQEEVLARVRVHLDNRQLVKQLSDANEDLQRLDQLKNKFLGMAAHDLRNPLGSIMGFTEMVIDGDFGEVSEEQASVLQRVHAASKRMLNLVNDLLDVSVIESGKLTLKMTHTSLKRLIEEQITLMGLEAGKKGISLIAAYETDDESEFDAERMIQVVNNLISNAIKFSDKDSQIKIGLRHEHEQMVIEVQDSGPGISEEDQQKLFGEFQRLSSKPTAGEKGTGLGLAISKKIVEAHRGQLKVDSRLGAGATFIVTIPVKNPVAIAEKS